MAARKTQARRRPANTRIARPQTPAPEPEVTEEEDGDEELPEDDDDAEDTETEETEAADDDDSEENGNQESGDETPELTKAEKVALFKAYQEAVDEVASVEAALKEAKGAQSDAVESIHDHMGVGPFKWRGDELRVIKRQGLFYMRVQKAESEEIG